MKNLEFMKQLFELEANTNVSTDFEPAISIDHVDRIVENINTLQTVLGITEMIPMAEGSTIKRYKTTVTKSSDAVAEGEVIGLSKVERKAIAPLTLTLNKYRKLCTAEAIQRNGREIALNQADDKLMKEVRKDVKTNFFETITTGKGKAAGGSNLQQACAQAWASLQVYFEDEDVTPIFFVNPMDVATYLGDATITTQEAFGFQYVSNFLGMGNAIITPAVTAGKVYATVSENLNGAYIPQSGDLASLFGLTYDESGLIGMTHSLATDRASLETLIMSGVLFYAEDESGVFVSAISAAQG